ncbi:MAG: hypothetical protein KJ709_06985, partial [Nanoarchaeota archaeon]|nr:hypothetical protein [Nanoarchaeota archaeon]
MKLWWIVLLIFLAGCVEYGSEITSETGELKEYHGREFTAYGTLVHLGEDTITLEAEVVDCNKNETTLVVNARPTTPVMLGQDYFVKFVLTGDRLEAMMLDQGYESCLEAHMDDLAIIPQYIFDERGIKKKDVLEPGMAHDFPFTIINRGRHDTHFRLLEATIHDFYMLRPDEDDPSDRLDLSRIPCEVRSSPLQAVVPAEGELSLNLSAICEYPEGCTRTITDCSLGSCEEKNLAACDFVLWARMTFDDELGFTHIIPEDSKGQGVIRRDLRIKTE